MKRELYVQLGGAAAAAMRIAKGRRVSVPELLGQIGRVKRTLDAGGQIADNAAPSTVGALELLAERAEVASHEWPAEPTTAERREQAAEREQQRRDQVEADNAKRVAAKLKAAAEQAERDATAAELAAADVEIVELAADD